MEGDIADLPAWSTSRKRYGARLFVDDAHSLGVLGPHGAGHGGALRPAARGRPDRRHLLKSFASIGGFVAGDEPVIHYLKHHAPAAHLLRRRCRRPTRRGARGARVLQRRAGAARGPVGQRRAACATASARSASTSGPPRRRSSRSSSGRSRHVHLLAEAVRRRRLHQPGRPAGGAAVAVPPAHLRDGHAHRGTDRPRARRLRQDRQGVGGHSDSAPVIRRVETAKDLTRFVDLPYRLYRRDLNWVPPLRAEVKKLLDRAKNPFFEHAEVDSFLAERDGEVVGRIAAITTGRTTSSTTTRSASSASSSAWTTPSGGRALRRRRGVAAAAAST